MTTMARTLSDRVEEEVWMASSAAEPRSTLSEAEKTREIESNSSHTLSVSKTNDEEGGPTNA